jgi:hypothetical protein
MPEGTMSFTIVAACTPSYVETLRFCYPSWVKNSGASKIVVEVIEGTEGPRETAWYDNTALRCEAACRNITAELDAGRDVVCLDVDCVVLGDLTHGFSPWQPISVARWPRFNMGVMFFGCGLYIVDVRGLLYNVTQKIKAECSNYRGELRPAGGCWLADQMTWQEILGRNEQFVYKLDADVWNFCPHLNDWEAEWERCKDQVKIVHLKGQGQTEKHELPKRLLKRDKGGLI